MEDALVLTVTGYVCKDAEGLNPCFNGRCTRTKETSQEIAQKFVLILVLMEDALVPARS